MDWNLMKTINTHLKTVHKNIKTYITSHCQQKHFDKIRQNKVKVFAKNLNIV